METPDNKIMTQRQEVYKQCGKDNFDAVCFLFYKCPGCGRESNSILLIPISTKHETKENRILQLDRISNDLKRQGHEMALQKIFNAPRDFLPTKKNCTYCLHHPKLILKRIIYCYNIDNVDYHNYIDYPFEQIKKYTFPLPNSESKSEKFLFIDIETTGLPKNWKGTYRDSNNWPRLVQLAWIIGDEKGNIISQRDYIIKPQNFLIPDDASKIHKISTSKAMQEGTDIKIVLEQFNQAVIEVDYIVAHNLKFDINVVASELYRNDMGIILFERKKICTMESSVNYCKLNGNYGYKYPKLEELYRKLFNATFNEVHNASADVRATFKCFYKLIDLNIIKI